MGIFNDMSISLYSIIILFFGGILIYGIIDMKKKKPGHPFANALIGLLIVGLFTIPYRFIKEYSTNPVLPEVSKYVMVIMFIAFIISFVYFAYMAYKRGYLDEKGKRLIKNTILPCAIIFLICVVVIVGALYLKSKGL